jgi:hypothetical protein
LIEILVPHAIRRREFGATVPDEARRVFAKLKGRPELAATLAAPDLPPRTTLHKVYATTASGARRLLFFCRPVPPTPQTAGTAALPVARWILLFYRSKTDPVGTNLSPRNPVFVRQLNRQLRLALEDLTAAPPKYEAF